MTITKPWILGAAAGSRLQVPRGRAALVVGAGLPVDGGYVPPSEATP